MIENSLSPYNAQIFETATSMTYPWVGNSSVIVTTSDYYAENHWRKVVNIGDFVGMHVICKVIYPKLNQKPFFVCVL